MIKAGDITIPKLYAGGVKICSAYINGELVFSGGCSAPYKWIADETSILCEQEDEPDVTEITGLKSPHAIKLRNNGIDVFIFDYFSGAIYKVNLNGLASATNKVTYIYNSPSYLVGNVTNSSGGGMVYDYIKDRIWAYTSASKMHVINPDSMSQDTIITFSSLSSGANARSRPSISIGTSEVWAYGNGGFERFSTETKNTIIGANPGAGVIFSMNYEDIGIALKDASIRTIIKYDLNSGNTLDTINASTYGDSWRGFYFHEPTSKLYFVDSNNSTSSAFLVCLDLISFTVTLRTSLTSFGQSGIVGGTSISFYPVDGLLYVTGNIGGHLSIWKYQLDGTYITGYHNTSYSGMVDSVYNPQNNKIMGIVRGAIENETDGAILYLS